LSEVIAAAEEVKNELQRLEIGVGCLEESLISDKLADSLKKARAAHHRASATVSAILEALLGIVDRLEGP
jgi:hypothetical protein